MSPFFHAGWKLANPFLALKQMWGYSYVPRSWSFWEADHLWKTETKCLLKKCAMSH